MRIDTAAPRFRSAVAVAAAGLLLAGCSNEPVAGPEPAPSSAPAPDPSATSSPSAAPSSGATGGDVDPAALEWTSSLCTALTPLTERFQTPPTPDLADSAATQQTFSSYLAAAAGDAEQAATDIAAAGAPPVDDEEIGTAVSGQVEELRTELSEAMTRIDAVDPANPIAVGRAAVGAGADIIGSLGGIVEVTTAVSDDPMLGPAFEQSPECAPLRMIAIPT